MTSGFFRRLRLAELVTSVCILAMLTVVLIDRGRDDASSSASAATSPHSIVVHVAPADADLVTALKSVRTALES